MEMRVLRRSLIINAVAILIATLIAFMLARRAQGFSDLVYVVSMMYLAAIFFLANLMAAAVQAWRRKEWVAHAVMALGSSAACGALLIFVKAF